MMGSPKESVSRGRAFLESKISVITFGARVRRSLCDISLTRQNTVTLMINGMVNFYGIPATGMECISKIRKLNIQGYSLRPLLLVFYGAYLQ